MADQETAELRAALAELQERLATVEAELAATRNAAPGAAHLVSVGPADGTDAPTATTEPTPFGRRDLLRRGGVAAGAAVAGTAAMSVLTASPAAAATVTGSGNPGVSATGVGGPGVVASSTSSAAVVATSSASAGVYGGTTAVGFGGVQGEVVVDDVFGVVGKHSGGGVGVMGSTSGAASTNCVGVLGTTASDSGVGVRGTSSNADTVGVFGDTSGANSTGVYGAATGTDGVGVLGLSTTGMAAKLQGGGAGAGAALHLVPLGLEPTTRSGTHYRGEIIADTGGGLWFCTSTGTPGTWRQLAADDSAGTLHLLANPPRIYDSRNSGGKFADKTERTIDATKRTNGSGSGVPAGATGVLVNLVATDTNPGGFAALWATGLYPGNASLNWGSANMTIGNGTTTAVTPAGTFRCRVEGGANIIIDVIGYYR